MEFKEFKYSLNVWHTTFFVSPVIMYICEYAENNSRPSRNYATWADEVLSTYFAVAFGNALFSILPYIFFYMILKIASSSLISITRMKTTASIAGVGLTLGMFAVLFSFVGGDGPNDLIYLVIGNCLCIAWFCWFYRLQVNEIINY